MVTAKEKSAKYTAIIDFIYRPIKPFNRFLCSIEEKCYIFANRKSEDWLQRSIIKQACFCIRFAQSLHR